jgi:type VI protein secretion system component Hcp
MAERYYLLSIKFDKTGSIRGSSTGSHHKSYIDGVVLHGFSYGVQAPYDSSSGQATGKRQHQPIVITKTTGEASPLFWQALPFNESIQSIQNSSSGQSSGKGKQPIVITKQVDQASPLFMNAHWNSETLPHVKINVTGQPSGKKPVPYHTIELTNAQIVEIRKLGIASSSHRHRGRPTEQITLICESLRINGA